MSAETTQITPMPTINGESGAEFAALSLDCEMQDGRVYLNVRQTNGKSFADIRVHPTELMEALRKAGVLRAWLAG